MVPLLCPDPVLLPTVVHLPAWQIRCWNGPAHVERASQDAHRLAVLPAIGGPRVLRAVVCDGLTPGTQTPHIAGMDGARYAAELSAAALVATADVHGALTAVNQELLSRTDLPTVPRERPTTGVVLVDVPLDVRTPWASFTAVYDCQIWTLSQEHGWTQVLPAAQPSPQVQQARTRFRTEHPHAPVAQYISADAIALGEDASSWGCRPLGLTAELDVRNSSVRVGPGHVERIVLASDGAQLNAARLEEGLEFWLGQLRRWEHDDAVNRQQVKVHDDVTVIELALR